MFHKAFKKALIITSLIKNENTLLNKFVSYFINKHLYILKTICYLLKNHKYIYIYIQHYVLLLQMFHCFVKQNSFSVCLLQLYQKT